MGLETANFIGQLVSTNPTNLDQKSQGDDHLRLLKEVLKNTFPDLTFPVAFNETTKVVIEAITLAAMRTALGVPGLAEANVFTATQTLRLADDGSGSGPALILDRSSDTPADLDLLGRLVFQGRNSLAVSTTFADAVGQIISKTSASESGALLLRTMLAGSYGVRFGIGAGLYSLNATDGDKGVDTINAKHIYKDGVEVNPATDVIKKVYVGTYATNTNLTTTIPLDDTAPTSSEGTEIISIANVITTTTTQRVRGSFSCIAACGTDTPIAAIFRGSTCIQVQVGLFMAGVGSINTWGPISVEFDDAPAAAGTYTYSVRAGGAVGTIRLNGSLSARFFGGEAKAVLKLEVYEPPV